jgi:putative transposase
MPRYRRLVVPGYPHHVTQRGVRRQKTFFDDRDYCSYLSLATDLLTSHSIEVLAYCLMPNHVHAVVIPQHDNSLASFFGKLHQRYAKYTNCRYDWSGHLWQNRFYSVVMDERHTLTALRYVERNPVRSGLVELPEDWQWSSARGNLGMTEDPLIRNRPALKFVSNWANYVSGSENPCEVAALRRMTGTGRPKGNKDFVAELESLSGRRIRMRSRGRPKK